MIKRNQRLTLDNLRAGIAAGKNAAQIASELGVSRPHVCNVASKNGLKFPRASLTAKAESMMRDGAEPEAVAAATGMKLSSVMTIRSRSGLGPTRERGAELIVDSLPADIRSWVRHQIPNGASAADLLRSFIVDAYHDEVGK